MTQRLSVADAAKLLGVSKSAIRQRIRRGTLEYEKGDDGRVWVYISPEDVSSTGSSNTVDNALLLDYVEELKQHTRFLENQLEKDRDEWREEARRKDHIIMALTQRIPELEPASEIPSDAPESPVTATEEKAKGQVPPEPETAESEPWWRRIFR